MRWTSGASKEYGRTGCCAGRSCVDVLHRARSVGDLRYPSGNRLEVLRGDRAGRWSLRVNDQYRITFRFEDGHAREVACEDYAIIRGKRGVSADTALRLARLLDTSAELWLGLQSDWDLWHAAQAFRKAG